MGYIIFAVLVVIGLWVVFAYNSLIRLSNRVAEAWSDIEVQLKRRYDLIPNLVSTVKGYATHEASTLEKVTDARAKAISAGSGTLADKAQAENMLSGALKSLFAVSEAYPDLKANTNFLELQRELTDTEDKIQAARRFYNTMVRDINTRIQSFPSSIIASLFHFAAKEFFDLPDADVAQNPIQVKF